MKNIFLLLLFASLFSCNYEEQEVVTESNQDSFSETSLRIVGENNPMKDSLRVISYAMGRVFQRNESIRDNIRIELQSNPSMDAMTFGDLLSDQAIKEALELQIYYVFWMGHPATNPNRPKPPVGSIEGKKYTTEEALAIAEEYITYIEENCFELYFPRPFTINNQQTHIYTFHHPLGSYHLYNCKIWIDVLGKNQGDFPTIGARFIDEILEIENGVNGILVENVIVVRPFEDDCNYSIYYLTEFFPRKTNP